MASNVRAITCTPLRQTARIWGRHRVNLASSSADRRAGCRHPHPPLAPRSLAGRLVDSYDRHSCLSISAPAIPQASSQPSTNRGKRQPPGAAQAAGLHSAAIGGALGADRQECLSYRPMQPTGFARRSPPPSASFPVSILEAQKWKRSTASLRMAAACSHHAASAQDACGASPAVHQCAANTTALAPLLAHGICLGSARS